MRDVTTLPRADVLEGNRIPAERESNLELYRILVMLLIVAHHYVVNSGLNTQMYRYPGSTSAIFLYLFGAWGKTGINCFVLITGYFMCRSNISARKFAKLLFEGLFYLIVVRMIFWVTGYEPFTWAALREVLCPVTAVESNFIDCYLIFFLLIPFLNTLLRNISQWKHMMLLCICLGVYTVLASLSWASVRINYVTWFCVLYLVVAYIRLYPNRLFANTRFWGIAMLVSLGLSVVSILSRMELLAISKVYFYLSDSNKILAVTNALTSFLFFKNLKMKHCKWINTVGATTYGVLLIHANCDSMRKWLWQDVLKNSQQFGSSRLLVHAVVSVVGIFVICSFIDWLRIRFLEKPFFRFWDKHWHTIEKHYYRLEQKIQVILSIKE